MQSPALPPRVASSTAALISQAAPPTSVRVDGLRYTARVLVRPDSLLVAAPGSGGRSTAGDRLHKAVTVTNVTHEPVALDQWPGCFGTVLLLERVPEDSDSVQLRRAVWSEEKWRSAFARATGAAIECDFTQVSRVLGPGDSYTVPLREANVRINDVLGDSLPDGRYRAVVIVRSHIAPASSRPSISLSSPPVVIRRKPRPIKRGG